MVRTSIDIPEDLYNAFKKTGGVLSVLVREAIQDYIGIRGASEDALVVLELRMERFREEKLNAEKRFQEFENKLSVTSLQIKEIKSNIRERDLIKEQAEYMLNTVNPYIRAKGYVISSNTEELHKMIVTLRELGLEHTLESLQKWASRLSDADYLKDHI